MNPDHPDPNPNLARDHLANERTFLAWVRTALGLIGLGFVLARMGLFLRQLAAATGVVGARGIRAHPGIEFLATGVIFLGIGTVVCGWAGHRYRTNRRDIDAGRYIAAESSVMVLTALVVIGGLVIATMVVWRTMMEGER